MPSSPAPAPSLATARVVAPSSSPSRWILFLHGILGSGANWRTFAKQIVTERPDWGAILVDLRLHGDSVGFAPPHTLAASAADIVATIPSLDLGAGSVAAIFGHSFGGKVGVALADQLGAAGAGVEHLFIVDSNPGARPDGKGSESTRQVVELLMTLPSEFPDRNAFASWASERGLSRPITMWLAMNVRPVPETGAFVFRLDVAQIRTMLADYFAQDLWPVIEAPVEVARQNHLVVGGASTVVSAEELARAKEAPNTTVDVIEGAGHWIHVDAPNELRQIVLAHLS